LQLKNHDLISCELILDRDASVRLGRC